MAFPWLNNLRRPRRSSKPAPTTRPTPRTNNRAPTRLSNLPRDILSRIANHSNLETSARLGATSRQMRAVNQGRSKYMLAVVEQLYQVVKWELKLATGGRNFVMQTTPRNVAPGLKVMCEYASHPANAISAVCMVKLIDDTKAVVCQQVLIMTGKYNRQTKAVAIVFGRRPYARHRNITGPACKVFEDVVRSAVKKYNASPIHA